MAKVVTSKTAYKFISEWDIVKIDDKLGYSIYEFLFGLKKTFYLIVFLVSVLELLSLAPILYMINVYDRVITSRSGVTLVSLTLLIIGVYIFWMALDWVIQQLMIRLSLRIDWELGPNIFEASFHYYALQKNIDVGQLLEDLMNIRQFLTGAPLLSIIRIPFIPLFVCLCWMFHVYLMYFAIFASVLMLIFTYLTLKVASPILREAEQLKNEANKTAANGLRQAESILALGMLDALRNRWYNQHNQFLTKQVFASEASGLMGSMTGFLNKAIPSLQVALGVFLAIEGFITGGMVIAAGLLVSKALAPINGLLSNWKSIVNARKSYDRLNSLLERHRQFKDQMDLPNPVGNLDVDSATGTPPDSKTPVISDIKFSLQKGQSLVILGPSASGKTSLVKLLLGLWAPSAGSVRLDGVEISDWDHTKVGPYIGYVPQDIEFFEGTVAENIARLGDIDATKVVDAATLINMHEEILSFPKGYETPLGNAGYTLSGGQRQRIAIARALYGLPKYIVMDEPNSNLDDQGEKSLKQAMIKLQEIGSTFIITTHRASLINVVDFALVLKSGRQLAFGPAKAMIDAARNAKKSQAANAKPSEESAANSMVVAVDDDLQVSPLPGDGVVNPGNKI